MFFIILFPEIVILFLSNVIFAPIFFNTSISVFIIFGSISDYPDSINVNLGNMPQGYHDWPHTNSINYNEMYDQIVISSRRY